jgi:hypothetical protein
MAQPIKIPVIFRFLSVPINWTLKTTSVGGFAVLVGETKKGWSEQQINDGWECRQEFLKLPEGNNQALCRFMNKVGLFESENGSPGTKAETYHLSGGRAVTFPRQIHMFTDRIWGLRRVLDQDMLSEKKFIQLYASDSAVKSGLIPDLPFRFKLDADVAMGVLTTVALWEMLLVTIYVDLARGFHFQICQRPDCQVKFPVETAHERKFCSQYCGHLESMRKKRCLESLEKQKQQKKNRQRLSGRR